MDTTDNECICHDNPRREPIAVIGIGCRFPGGATDADSFWKMMLDRTDAITDVPPDRWNHSIIYHPEPGKPGGQTLVAQSMMAIRSTMLRS